MCNRFMMTTASPSASMEHKSIKEKKNYKGEQSKGQTCESGFSQSRLHSRKVMTNLFSNQRK